METFVSLTKAKKKTYPLHMAVEAGKLNEVKKLLKDGKTDIDTLYLKSSGLHFAAEKGNFLMVKLFLDRCAKVNLKDGSDYTPLMRAAEKNNFEIVKALILKGANLHFITADGVTSLTLAAKERRHVKKKILLV